MEVKENLPIMVLTQESPHRLLFQFKSVLWGYITLSISISLCIATYLALQKTDVGWLVLTIPGILSLLFLYSSIYSFNLCRSLEIDQIEQVVRYKESIRNRKIEWRKDFRDFKSIKIFRPLTTATSPGGRRAINWSIQLISNEDEVFDIGSNQFGAMNRKKAEELLGRIVAIMGIRQEIVD